jgi:ATP-binding cassette subfamily B protein
MYNDDLYDDGFEGPNAAARRIDAGLWRRLGQFAAPYRGSFVAFALCAVTTAAMDVSLPLIMRGVIDTIGRDGADAVLWPWGLAFAACATVLSGSIAAFIYFGGRIRTRISHDIRRAAFANVQDLSFAFFDKRPVGWLMARMTSDCERLSNIFAWGVLDLVWGTTVMLGSVVAMLFMSPLLTLVVVSIVPILAIASGRFQQRILGTAREVRRNNARITASFNESVTGVITTRSFGREDDNHARFGGLTDAMYDSSVRNLLYSALYLPLVLSLASLAFGLALTLGGVELLTGAVTAGTIVAFLTYARHFFEPVEQLTHWFAELQMAQASAERIISLVDAEPDVRDSPEVRARGAAARPNGRIEAVRFADVGFRYGDGPVVLDGVELELRRGATTALVGHTGSGKSTLASVLCRYYEPTSGHIELDTDTGARQEYRGVPLADWQRRLGVVLQTPHVFAGTIAQNVRFGRLDATAREIQQAIDAVGAGTFVRALPGGVEFQVGEAGGRLSAGQKQLVSLARVMLADPEVVVLDEATSSIDSDTEKQIEAAMATLLEDRVALVIAHRLSTIRDAANIVVMAGGRILEEGSHGALLARDGAYAALFRTQQAQRSTSSDRFLDSLADPA